MQQRFILYNNKSLQAPFMKLKSPNMRRRQHESMEAGNVFLICLDIVLDACDRVQYFDIGFAFCSCQQSAFPFGSVEVVVFEQSSNGIQLDCASISHWQLKPQPTQTTSKWQTPETITAFLNVDVLGSPTLM